MKRTIAIIIALFIALSMIGCKAVVSQEEYDKLLLERDEYKNSAEQYKADSDTANAKITDLTAQISELLAEKTALQTEYNDYFEKSSEFNHLTEVEKQAALDVASRQKELDDIQAQSDALENQMTDLGDSISELTSKKTELEDEINVLKNKIIEYKEAPVQLTNGSYTAGRDFKAGIYDLYAVAGNGDVTTEDPHDYANALFLMMSVRASDYTITNYQNAMLSDGTVIKITGVTIELREKAN
jgi:phage host-nuclease inhibitor protein Gam